VPIKVPPVKRPAYQELATLGALWALGHAVWPQERWPFFAAVPVAIALISGSRRLKLARAQAAVPFVISQAAALQMPWEKATIIVAVSLFYVGKELLAWMTSTDPADESVAAGVAKARKECKHSKCCSATTV
jgi:hypothetical protein